MESYGCWYCVPSGEIDGLMEVLSRNRVVLFTPDIDGQVMQYQCIVHVDDIHECAVISAPLNNDDSVCHFLQLQIADSAGQIAGEIFFRFTDRSTVDLLCRTILAVKSSPDTSNISSEGVSQIPFFSDHIELSPEPSPPLESPSPPPLLSPPPICVNASDKAAVEFSGDYLLDSESAADIRELLPLEHRFGEFRLLFTPKLHGISVPSFFRRSEDMGTFPSFIIIKDSPGCCTFGAFVKMPWTLSRRYYGSAESFVFTLIRKGVRDVAMYGSGGANRYYQYADEKCVVIGGGSKKSDAAISIFSSWLRGTSGACETFGTRHSLCCSSEFIIGDIEFWSVLPETVASVRPSKSIELS